MTTSYSLEQPKSQSRAWEWFKSVASEAWEWLKPYVGKWIQVLIGLGILVLASKLSWLFVAAVLVLAYIIFRQ